MKPLNESPVKAVLGMNGKGEKILLDFERTAHLIIGGGMPEERQRLAERIMRDVAEAEVVWMHDFGELQTMKGEVERRLALFHAEGCRDLKEYACKTGEKVKHLVCFADSGCLLNERNKEELMRCMDRLGPFGRHTGVHLVLLCDTLVPNWIRQYIPGRIAFRTKTCQESMSILDAEGAELISEKHVFMFTEDGEKTEMIQPDIRKKQKENE